MEPQNKKQKKPAKTGLNRSEELSAILVFPKDIDPEFKKRAEEELEPFIEALLKKIKELG
jgi:hypothetical protein